MSERDALLEQLLALTARDCKVSAGTMPWVDLRRALGEAYAAGERAGALEERGRVLRELDALRVPAEDARTAARLEVLGELRRRIDNTSHAETEGDE